MKYTPSQIIEGTEPLQLDSQELSNTKQGEVKEYLEYKDSEVLTIGKETPSQELLEELTTYKNSLNGRLKGNASIKSIKCKANNRSHIELWRAPEINTLVHGDSIKVTTSPTPKTVSALNFNIKIQDKEKITIRKKTKSVARVTGEPIIVAVLDTGIDLNLISEEYLWVNEKVKDSKKSYGYNFIYCDCDINDDEDNADEIRRHKIEDDSPDMHGTLVSQYIINSFKESKTNNVQLMILKTHDNKGNGHLFNIINAIDFAIENGAHIINASWGFYSYDKEIDNILYKLIAERIEGKDILFVTASGNQIDEEDSKATKIFQMKKTNYAKKPPEALLRNLEKHIFLPACLSNDTNNIITVTTSDEFKVSQLQNYSKKYVDLAIKRDKLNDGKMKFRLPFPGTPKYIHGSSYAAAIATGKIAGHCAELLRGPKVTKDQIFGKLGSKQKTFKKTRLTDFIKEGRISMSV